MLRSVRVCSALRTALAAALGSVAVAPIAHADDPRDPASSVRGIERPAEDPTDAARAVGGVLLYLPLSIVELFFFSTGAAAGVLQDRQVVPRVRDLLFSSGGEIGVFPTIFAETGGSPNFGARMIARTGRAATMLRAGYGGPDEVVVERGRPAIAAGARLRGPPRSQHRSRIPRRRPGAGDRRAQPVRRRGPRRPLPRDEDAVDRRARNTPQRRPGAAPLLEPDAPPRRRPSRRGAARDQQRLRARQRPGRAGDDPRLLWRGGLSYRHPRDPGRPEPRSRRRGVCRHRARARRLTPCARLHGARRTDARRARRGTHCRVRADPLAFQHPLPQARHRPPLSGQRRADPIHRAHPPAGVSRRGHAP